MCVILALGQRVCYYDVCSLFAYFLGIRLFFGAVLTLNAISQYSSVTFGNILCHLYQHVCLLKDIQLFNHCFSFRIL